MGAAEHSALIVTLARHQSQPVTGEQRLWLSAISLAVFDAYFGVGRQAHELRADALRWIASPAFEDACDYAGLDPAFVRRLLRDLEPHARRRQRRRAREQIARTAAVTAALAGRLTKAFSR